MNEPEARAVGTLLGKLDATTGVVASGIAPAKARIDDWFEANGIERNYVTTMVHAYRGAMNAALHATLHERVDQLTVMGAWNAVLRVPVQFVPHAAMRTVVDAIIEFAPLEFKAALDADELPF